MSLNLPALRLAGATLALAIAAPWCTQASANSLAEAGAGDNLTFTGATRVTVASVVTDELARPATNRLVVTFSAECAGAAPDGATDAWIDVDIVLRDAVTGAVVYTATPSADAAEAFCSTAGAPGVDHWQTHTVQAAIPGDLAGGHYRASVRARQNRGGEHLLSLAR